MPPKTAIHWFRQDLRLNDNPALSKACEAEHILPIYILDDTNAGEHLMGGASRVWLHHSLAKLNTQLNDSLSLYHEDPLELIPALIKQHNIEAIYWNRCYEPWRITRDTQLKKKLEAMDIEVESFNGSLLWEPWEITKDDGTPYKVFTPFYRKGCLNATQPREPLKAPTLPTIITDNKQALPLEKLSLLPSIGWDKPMVQHWEIGEEGAKQRLLDFIDEGLSSYKDGRNFPAKPYVSRLSPYLHFGEISPHQIWQAIATQEQDKNTDHFCSELGWREFSFSLLYYNQELPRKNLQEKFDQFPWKENKEYLQRWQKGQTGYPIVDAGMRELWQTGSMHNRVRMIVGSFLVKNLLLHWHHGEAWFWDCLFDADLANNSASWQWVAGCGADAAPYFRIFNPVTQGQKFDADGEYTKKYVPELKDLDNKYLFCPWDAPEKELKKANIELGTTYPKPIVPIKSSREEALAAFSSLKKSA